MRHIKSVFSGCLIVTLIVSVALVSGCGKKKGGDVSYRIILKNLGPDEVAGISLSFDGFQWGLDSLVAEDTEESPECSVQPPPANINVVWVNSSGKELSGTPRIPGNLEAGFSGTITFEFSKGDIVSVSSLP